MPLGTTRGAAAARQPQAETPVREPSGQAKRLRYRRGDWSPLSVGMQGADSRIALWELQRVESCPLLSATPEVGHMTANWAATLVNVLILAFFVVIGVGIGIGAYAASVLKKNEQEQNPAA